MVRRPLTERLRVDYPLQFGVATDQAAQPRNRAVRPAACPAPFHRAAAVRLAGMDNPVLVVDFGAQYAQLIARRVREAQVYSEIVPHSVPVADLLARKPAAIILSGGPASVYEPGAPQIDPALFTAGGPVLGICTDF